MAFLECFLPFGTANQNLKVFLAQTADAMYLLKEEGKPWQYEEYYRDG